MFELVFLFTGLCAFVLDNPTQPRSLEVLLVDARTDPGNPDHVAHANVLVVRNDETTSTWPPDEPSDLYGTDHRGALIEGLLVTVDGATSGPITFESTRPPGSLCPTTDDELAAYGWVPKLGRVGKPGAASAAVTLTNGSLSTRSVSLYDNPTSGHKGIAIWSFNDPRCPADTALADVVEFRQRVTTCSVGIKLTDLEGNLVHTLTLQPSPNRPLEVVVEIKNVPKREICCPLPDGVKEPTTDSHFAHLSRLLPDGSPNCVPSLTPAICLRPANHPRLPKGLCSRICAIPANPQCPGADQSGP